MKAKLLLTLELNDEEKSRILVYKRNKSFRIWKSRIVNGREINEGRSFNSFQLHVAPEEIIAYLKELAGDVEEDQITMKEETTC